MSSRIRVGVIAAVAVLLMWVAAAFLPLPYVIYSPGPTVNVLGKFDGKQIITVDGEPTYPTGGELRMTTVRVTNPDARIHLFEAMRAWLSNEQAIYPREAVYAPNETQEDTERESALQMASSQDVAVAAALTELGYHVDEVPLTILAVTEGAPADGKLKVHDQLIKVGGVKVTKPKQVVDLVQADPPGQPLEIVVRRDGAKVTVQVTPKKIDGAMRIGVTPGPGFRFPFEVSMGSLGDIGGPSAGTIFALGIIDTLTPGELTGGDEIAGTGEIAASGQVGPIGGIQQKIVAARNAGAGLFLVPAENCAEALGAPNGSMRLAKIETLHQAREVVTDWAADHSAKLPLCEAS